MNTKLLRLALVLVFTGALAVSGLLIAPSSADAASCTNYSTRTISSGCCGCNNVQKQDQTCIYGTWYTTNTWCDYSSCCAYPCCV